MKEERNGEKATEGWSHRYHSCPACPDCTLCPSADTPSNGVGIGGGGGWGSARVARLEVLAQRLVSGEGFEKVLPKVVTATATATATAVVAAKGALEGAMEGGLEVGRLGEGLGEGGGVGGVGDVGGIDGGGVRNGTNGTDKDRLHAYTLVLKTGPAPGLAVPPVPTIGGGSYLVPTKHTGVCSRGRAPSNYRASNHVSVLKLRPSRT